MFSRATHEQGGSALEEVLPPQMWMCGFPAPGQCPRAMGRAVGFRLRRLLCVSRILDDGVGDSRISRRHRRGRIEACVAYGLKHAVASGLMRAEGDKKNRPIHVSFMKAGLIHACSVYVESAGLTRRDGGRHVRKDFPNGNSAFAQDRAGRRCRRGLYSELSVFNVRARGRHLASATVRGGA